MNLKGGRGDEELLEKDIEMMLIQYLYENFKIYLLSISIHPSTHLF